LALPRRPNFRQNERSDVWARFRQQRCARWRQDWGLSGSSALPSLAGNKVESRQRII